MKKRKTQIAVATALSLVMASTSLLAVGKDKAMYVGGTIPGVSEKAEGRVNTSDDKALRFVGEDGSIVEIAYRSISELEYGQKAGRRVAMAVLVSPWALLSKKRNHYLTITYKDRGGKQQAGVFELGKDIVRTTLKVLEVRTGREIEFQDAEACKQYKTPKECEAQ
ncbi:MAG: hypothetical protein AB7O67_08430 [Vicinamibacterales bacterium]